MAAEPQPKKSFIERYGALAGAIAAIATLIFLFFPDLRPRETPDIDVEITTVGIERDIAYGTYLTREGLAASGNSECELAANGMVIKPTIELTGLRGQSLQIQSTLYKVDRGRVPVEWYRGMESLQKPGPEYRPTSQKDIWVFENWILYPQAEGDFYLRLELFLNEENGLRSLGYKDTEPFHISLYPDCVPPVPDVPFPPDALTPPG